MLQQIVLYNILKAQYRKSDRVCLVPSTKTQSRHCSPPAAEQSDILNTANISLAKQSGLQITNYITFSLIHNEIWQKQLELLLRKCMQLPVLLDDALVADHPKASSYPPSHGIPGSRKHRKDSGSEYFAIIGHSNVMCVNQKNQLWSMNIVSFIESSRQYSLNVLILETSMFPFHSCIPL